MNAVRKGSSDVDVRSIHSILGQICKEVFWNIRADICADMGWYHSDNPGTSRLRSLVLSLCKWCDKYYKCGQGSGQQQIDNTNTQIDGNSNSNTIWSCHFNENKRYC